MTHPAPDICIYHANCADGFGAAWAVWTAFPDCEFVPASYGEPPRDVTGKHVLIVDFSYSHNTLQQMARTAQSVVVLDHHKTAQADLGRLPEPGQPRQMVDIGEPLSLWAKFDMNKSGARLAWEYVFPAEPAPLLIELIEDRDLWRFQYPETRAFGMWLRSHPFDFCTWEAIAQTLATDRDSILNEARAIERYFDGQVEAIAQTAYLADIGGEIVPVVNCSPMFASEVGHRLLELYSNAAFAATWCEGGYARKYSLRSADDRADVSAVAKRYGGGGHRNAAGFEVPRC